jgi:hypothetical protein
VRKVAVGLLLESFCDPRGNARRRRAKLLSKPQVSVEGGALDDRRNRIGCGKCFLKNLQFFDAFGSHSHTTSTFRANSKFD